MNVTAEDFRRHYQLLSDEALLEIDTSELVELARTCHAEEVARRGLDENDSDDTDATGVADSDPGSGVAEEAKEELVCVVEYDYVDEAELALGLLEAAEITASLESEPGAVRLMVPAGMAEMALQLLTAPLSDEELAAQAEEAGFDDDEAEEEPVA